MTWIEIIAIAIVAAAFAMPVIAAWMTRDIPKYPPHPQSPYWEQARQREAAKLARRTKK